MATLPQEDFNYCDQIHCYAIFDYSLASSEDITTDLTNTQKKRCVYQDAVAVDDGVEAVSNGEHSAFFKLLPDGLLDQLVCPVKHI